ncbi:hypothetical protein GCM10010238_45160 [Streptomyces griseoviridis]|uniref:Uncharacterized protein n=1 Tax=Streptomyces griseoviridis TaxID=45398 RepID=A0A918GPA7_STRGD|nr:hypothetical protein GCM10010238_45160 [Streptomyces niveoruber]
MSEPAPTPGGPTRVTRATAGTALVCGALLLTLTALACPTVLAVRNTTGGPHRVIAETRYGPLTEADRDFVVKCGRRDCGSTRWGCRPWSGGRRRR